MARYSRGAFISIVKSAPEVSREAVRLIRSLDQLQHVELWLEHIPDVAQIRELREMLDGLEILIHGPFIHLSFTSHLSQVNDLSVKRTLEALECAHELGARVFTIHAGAYPVFDEHECALNRLAEAYCELRKQSSVPIAIENMPARRGASVETLCTIADVRQFCKIVKDAVLTLDVGHCIQNGESVKDAIHELAGRIHNIHLHDAVQYGRGHLRLGDGQLDLEAFLRSLEDIRYKGFVGLETLSFEDTASSWLTLGTAWQVVSSGIED